MQLQRLNFSMEIQIKGNFIKRIVFVYIYILISVTVLISRARDEYYEPTEYSTRLEYQEMKLNGNVKEMIVTGYKIESTKKVLYYKNIYKYKYDKNNNLIERNIYDSSNDLTSKYEYKYSKNGKLIERNISEYKVYHNADGKCIDKVFKRKCKYIYDKKGNVIEINNYAPRRSFPFLFSSLAEKHNFKYEDNNLIECVYYRDFSYYSCGMFIYRYQYIYDAKGNIFIKTEHYQPGKKIFLYDYKYDKKGNLKQKNYYSYKCDEVEGNKYRHCINIEEILHFSDDNTLIGLYDYRYFDNGNLIEDNYYKLKLDELKKTYEYKYDDKGNQIEENIYKYIKKSGETLKVMTYITEWQYEYYK